MATDTRRKWSCCNQDRRKWRDPNADR
jgi:hypothetical protein